MRGFARKAVVGAFKQINRYIDEASEPPAEGSKPRAELVIDSSLVKGTRGYLIRVVDQINGTYENGWYDACAIMLRRLIETLIIEVYVETGRSEDIKKNGRFMRLDGLVKFASNDNLLALDESGNTLRKLKDIGNWSAHKRRYNANRQDIDRVLPAVRIVVQEMVYLAKYK